MQSESVCGRCSASPTRVSCLFCFRLFFFEVYFRYDRRQYVRICAITRGLIVGFIMLALQGLQAGEIVTRLHQ